MTRARRLAVLCAVALALLAGCANDADAPVTFSGDDVQKPARVLSGPDILRFQELARQVVVAEDVARYAVRLVDASRPGRTGDQHTEWFPGVKP